MKAQRLFAALIALALSLPAAIGFTALQASADGNAASSNLKFLGFIKNSELTGPDGTHPQPGTTTMVGADDANHEMWMYDRVERLLFAVDTTPPDSGDWEQVAAIRTQSLASVTAVDPTTHFVYLGNQVSAGGNCIPLPEVCSTSVAAAESQIEVVDPSDPSTNDLYTLPASTAGLDIAAMTPTTTPDGDPVLVLLLYQGTQGNFDPAVSHHVVLLALDPRKLLDGKGDAELWQSPYEVPGCASLLSWSTNNGGGAREYLGVDPKGAFIYFGCRGLMSTVSSSHFVPAGAIVVALASARGKEGDLPASATSFSTSFYPNGAPANFASTSGDQPADLLLFGTAGEGTENKLYVFNALHRAWTGSMPFAVSSVNHNLWGVATDPSTGRAYVYYPNTDLVASEITQLPVPQGATLPLGDLLASQGGFFPIVDPATHDIFLPINGSFSHTDDTPANPDAYPADDEIAVYQDVRPVDAPAPQADPDSLTHQVPLTPDVPVSYGAFASAYGSQVIAVGGVHNAAVIGNATNGDSSPSQREQDQCTNANLVGDAIGNHIPCDALIPSTSDGSRSFTFGQVTQTEMSNSGAKGAAASVTMDDSTNADGKSLSNYNPAVDVWNRFLGGVAGPSPDLPGAGAVVDPSQQFAPATCSDLNSKPQNTPNTNGSQASCDATKQVASAGAAAPDALTGSPVQIAYSASLTRVTQTADNQSQTQAAAEAHGVRIQIPGGPSISIGDVLSTATSTAAGMTGTAKSIFTRSIREVTVTDPSGAPVFSCGFGADDPCDPRQLTDAVSAQSPSPVEFLTPNPDSAPSVTGSPGGAQAEVIKSAYQYWNDYFTNSDNGYEIPGLQIVVVGDQDQPSRIVVNLAGVHVESHDAIGLPPPPPPALPAPTLQLTLTDGATPPVPLAGGAFTLQGPDGTDPQSCTTAADGIGDCAFKDLKPGDYTIHEATPPPGFAAAPDFQLSMDAGQAYTATFVNLPAIGAAHVSLMSAGDNPQPLSGAQFAMFTGSSALGDPAATCTTDATGVCGFDKVPLGDYTMHQVTAPDGYLTSDDVQFSLTEPGQDEKLNFVDGTPGVAAVPPKVIPGKPAVPPHTEVIQIPGTHVPTQQPQMQPASYQTSSVPPPVVSTKPVLGTPPLVLGGGPLASVTRLPAQLARLLVHSPQQALLLLFVWIVLGLPVYLFVRRRQFIVATERA